ncbi:MAG: sulfotransferase domain-containing protein, partial [Pseudomonadota bacterium]
KVDYYGKKVVLLVRHPGDVAVSQYFQWRYRMRENKKALNDYPEHGAMIEAPDFVLNHEAGLTKAIEFMNDWAREAEAIGELFIIKYEDLRKKPNVTLQSLMMFVGLDASDEEITEAVRFASFDNMRELEERAASSWFGGGRLKPKDKTDKNSFKTRKGEVGGWRKEFAAEHVAAIDARIRDELDPVFGYSTSASARKPEEVVMGAAS